jgi:hypothetical protein
MNIDGAFTSARARVAERELGTTPVARSCFTTVTLLYGL